MKRILALVLALIAITACAHAEGADADPRLLLAEEAAQRLTALCGVEDYAALFMTDEELLDMIRGWGGDWSAPQNLRRAALVSINRNAFEKLLPALLQAGGYSDALLAYTDYAMLRMVSVPASMVNSRFGGQSMLAAASVASYSEMRALEGFESGISYVLMDFGEEHPMILGCICVGEDGAATIGASIVDMGTAAEMAFSIAGGEYNLKDVLQLAAAYDSTGAALALADALDGVELARY